MNTILLGIGGGLGALVVLLLALLVGRWRSDNSTDERVAEVVASLNARMDELGRELAGALERAEEEGRRSRIFGELAGSIDLDEVLSRTLEAAGALEDADAALVMLPDPAGGKPLVATLGLSVEEAERHAITGLHKRRYFHETLARECSRAHRYERKLSLIVFDLDDFKEVNDRIGHLAGDTVLAEAAERVRDVVRTADIACRVGGDEFAVILPESSLEDADQLYRRIQNAISSRPLGQGGKLFLSAGVAELRAEDDPVAFFQRADDALYRAKEAGKGRVVSANSPRLGPA